MDDGIEEWWWLNEAHRYLDWIMSQVDDKRCPNCGHNFEDCKCVG